jgi:hypothetical protein
LRIKLCAAAATQSVERCYSYVTRPHHFQRRALVRWDRDFPREPKPILWTSLYDDAAQFLIESPRSCTVKFFVEAGAHFFPAHHPIMPRKWMGKSTRRFKCSVAQNFPPHQTGATICFNVGAFSLSLLFYIFGAAYTLHFNFFH